MAVSKLGERTRDEKMAAAIHFFSGRAASEKRAEDRETAAHLRDIAEGVQECLRELAMLRTQVHHIEHTLSVH